MSWCNLGTPRRQHRHSTAGAPVAVVGRRPDSDQLIVEHALEAVHHQLVGATDQVDLVRLIELRNTGREWGGRIPGVREWLSNVWIGIAHRASCRKLMLQRVDTKVVDSLTLQQCA